MSAPVGARQIQEGPHPKELPRLPRPDSEGVIELEQHATMEHSRVSWAALRAGPATVARKCGPAGPSRGLGPAWADHKSSWAVPQEDLPEDEPDALY